MKKGRINDKIVDVVNLGEYVENKDLYDPEYTAIERDGMLFPVRGRRVDFNKPGYYTDGCIGFYIQPKKNPEDYSCNNIIDFSACNNMRELIEKSTALKDMHREILTNPDNIFVPRIDENDDEEMKALKQAIIYKNIDLDKYKMRFGKDFNNDKKKFNEPSITFKKLKSFADKFDMKLTLIIEDKEGDIPNPMGRKIVVNLNDQNSEDGDI